MKFLVFSNGGDGLSLAQRIEAEGNDVTFVLAHPNAKSKGVPGAGLVRKIVMGPILESPRKFISGRVGRDTIIVFDMLDAKRPVGPSADGLREDGYAVIGASRFQDALEMNRTYGTQIMESVGIPIPDTRSFTDFAEGIAFASTRPEFLVYKPHSNQDTATTIVADNPDILRRGLEQQARLNKGKQITFELQEKVDGIEVSVEGWFHGYDWIEKSFNSTIEEKKFFPGGLGPNTGCMGNVVWPWKIPRPKLVRDTLLRMTETLRSVGYIGPIDLNTKGGRGLEWTPRFGYSAIQAYSELWEDDVGKVLSDVARAQAKRFRIRTEFAGAVNLVVPPFPHPDKAEDSFGELIDVPEDVLPYFHPMDVQRDEDGLLACSGQSGLLGVVTATRRELDALEHLLYTRVKAVKADALMYRRDIVSYRARREIPTLLKESE